MDPIIGGLMSGAASLIGSVFSANTSAKNTQAQIAGQEAMQGQSEAFNAQQADVARQFSADQAQMQRDYQTQMSNTAFQRSRADAVAAGINPMALANMGGASTPSGAMGYGGGASVGTPSFPMAQTRSPFGDLGNVIRQGLDAAVSAKTFNKMSDEIANLQTQRQLIEAERQAAQQRAGLTEQERATEVERTKLTGATADTAALGLPQARFSAKQAESLLGLPQSVVDWMTRGAYVGGKAATMMQPFTDLISSAKGVKSLFGDRFYY